VTIDSTGVGWKCFHCGWTGGAFYEDAKGTRKTSASVDGASALGESRLSNTVTGTGAKRTSRALAIWTEAHSLPGTPASSYLSGRGISLQALPEGIGQALRWHPSCPWGEGGTRCGCLIALWTDAITGESRAIHRRPIGAAGEKVDGWKALGPTKGCVIRLSPDEMITTGLVIGEGIETTLAAATRVQHRGTLL